MDRNAVIIVTGAAGFIGSCLTGYLNRKGYSNIIIVDNFSDEAKKHNYEEKKICARVDKEELFDWLNRYKLRIDFVFHLGAYSLAETQHYLTIGEINTSYSKEIWNYCAAKKIPLVYTSFDAVLAGSVNKTMENTFDNWVAAEYNSKKIAPPFWAGLILSSVYGPNEYHKGVRASVIYRFFDQLNREGKITLQQPSAEPVSADDSHCDLVYVKDVVDVCYWMMQTSADGDNCPACGFYDVGSGCTHPQSDIADEIFKATRAKPNIERAVAGNTFDSSDSIKIADISRLRQAGYKKEFYSLADGVQTYIRHFLSENKYY